MGIPAAKDMLARTEAAASEALTIFGSRGDILRAAAHFVVSRRS
jgi:hypothetical protein